MPCRGLLRITHYGNCVLNVGLGGVALGGGNVRRGTVEEMTSVGGRLLSSGAIMDGKGRCRLSARSSLIWIMAGIGSERKVDGCR